MNNANRKIVMALGVLSLLMVAAMPSVLASTAAYVKYDGIDGESSDMDHEGWIDLVAVSQPLHKPGTGSGTARRRGDVILEDITVTKTSEVCRCSRDAASSTAGQPRTSAAGTSATHRSRTRIKCGNRWHSRREPLHK